MRAMTAAPLTTEEKRDKGGQRNLPEWKNCLTATRKRVQRVRPRLSSAPVSGQPSLRGRLLGTVFIPISHLRKLRLSMEGGDVPQVIQLGNSRTRAPPTERYHRVPWLWAESCERPSRFLKDSLILGDEPPSSAFLGNALVWVILPPEHKRTLWLWFQGSDVYLSLNTKPKSECLVTLAESEAAAAVHSRSAHSCAISALNPLSLCGIYSFFFFFNSFGANNMLC